MLSTILDIFRFCVFVVSFSFRSGEELWARQGRFINYLVATMYDAGARTLGNVVEAQFRSKHGTIL